MKHENIMSAIGRTPIVRLARFSRQLAATIYAKIEYVNPGGSIKDRMALYLIEDAEQRGLLRPGGTIVEATSGNTGIALAMIGAVKGYRVILVVPDRISTEKVNMLRALGAEVVIADGNVPPESPDSVYSIAERLTREIDGAVNPDQHRNPANPEAHYRTTAREIWEQMESDIDAVVIGIGTGGTLMGVGRFLKEKNSAIQLIGVDVAGSMLSERSRTGLHLIEGLGIDMDTPVFRPELPDDIIFVDNADAIVTAHQIARDEGMLVGGSSGANVCAARIVAGRLPVGSSVLTIFPDSGERYLSKYYNKEWLDNYGITHQETAA